MGIFERIGKMMDSIVIASTITHGDKWSEIEKDLSGWAEYQEDFDDWTQFEEDLAETKWSVGDFEAFWAWVHRKGGKSYDFGHDIDYYETHGLSFAILDSWVKSTDRCEPKRADYENFFDWFLRWIAAEQMRWSELNDDLISRQNLEKGVADGFWLQPKLANSVVTPAYLYGYLAGQSDRKLFDYVHSLLANPESDLTVSR